MLAAASPDVPSLFSRRAEIVLGHPVRLGVRWTVEQGTITPDAAREILAVMPKQRPLRPAHAEQLAKLLTGGKWDRNTPEPVVFDEEGLLLEGMHRMHACVMSGVPLVVDLKFNVPRSTFHVINRGRIRTAADDLILEGIVESDQVAKRLAAAGRVLRTFDAGFSPTSNYESRFGRLSSDDMAAVIRQHPLLPGTADYCTPMLCRSSVRFPHGAFVALLTLMREVDNELAMMFAEQIATGEHVGAGDPAYQLRESQGRDGHLKGRKAGVPAFMVRFVHAWNNLVDNRKVKRLIGVAKGDEAFPAISGYSRKA